MGARSTYGFSHERNSSTFNICSAHDWLCTYATHLHERSRGGSNEIRGLLRRQGGQAREALQALLVVASTARSAGCWQKTPAHHLWWPQRDSNPCLRSATRKLFRIENFKDVDSTAYVTGFEFWGSSIPSALGMAIAGSPGPGERVAGALMRFPRCQCQYGRSAIVTHTISAMQAASNKISTITRIAIHVGRLIRCPWGSFTSSPRARPAGPPGGYGVTAVGSGWGAAGPGLSGPGANPRWARMANDSWVLESVRVGRRCAHHRAVMGARERRAEGGAATWPRASGERRAPGNRPAPSRRAEASTARAPPSRRARRLR